MSGASARELERLLGEIAELEVRTDPAARAGAGGDFGKLVRGEVQAIARPRSVDALAGLVAQARAQGWRLTARSLGSSQSGQSVPRNGISVDMLGFTEVAIDRQANVARCGGGATWRDLVDAAAPHGLTPFVVPFNLDLTVAGVLSAGGIGSTSHAHGFAVSNVEQVLVVTGAGEIVDASRERRRDVYDAVLGGLGRFGFIVEVALPLRRMLPMTRTYYLLYDDLETMLADERTVMARPECTHLEGFASAAVQGIRRAADGRRAPFARWFFGMHVSIECAPETPPRDADALAGLHFRELLHTEDNSSADFAARYDPRFALMRATGAWEQLHPWFECLLPADAAPRLLPELVGRLPLLFGDGHRMMPIADVPRPGLFIVPEPAPAYGFAVLPAGVVPAFEAPALAGVAALHQAVVAAGGKRYLSGWLFEPDAASWREHFGPAYDTWMLRKRELDPDGVIESRLG